MAGKEKQESRKQKNKESGSGDSEPDLKKDRPFQSFFSKAQPLSVIIKGVVPEFRGMAAKEIEQYIEMEFEGKETNVEFDSSAKLLGTKGWAAGEAGTDFDIYFRLRLPNGTKTRFALYLDLEMQQNFSPGYDMGKRSVYYPARALSRQLTSLTDRKAYNRLQKVHAIWIFVDGYSKKLNNCIVTYSLRRTRTPDRRGREKAIYKLDRRIDLMDISYLFVGQELEEGEEEVLAFLNACFYEKAKLREHPEWVDPGNKELKEAADGMDGFAEFYERRGEKRGEKRGKKWGKKWGEKRGITKGSMETIIGLVKEGMKDGLTDATMIQYFRITQKKFDEIKELIEKYPDRPAQKLAEIYMEKTEDAAVLIGEGSRNQ